MEDMKKPNITEGEWYLMENGFGKDNQYHDIYATNDELEIICCVPKDNLLQKDQDHTSNAKAISAVPDIIEQGIHSTNLLKMLLKTVDLGEMDNEVSMQIQENLKALKKAGVEL